MNILLLLSLPILLPILLAPIGVTIMGYSAIHQIRRSQGRLYGLGLAVFDALIFPLLALDALICWLFYAIGDALVQLSSPDPTVTLRLWSVAPLPVLVCLAADAWIVRSVWRAVNKPLPNSEGRTPKAEGDRSRLTSAATPIIPSRPAYWNTVVIALLIAAVWGFFADLRQGQVFWFLTRLVVTPLLAVGIHWLVVRIARTKARAWLLVAAVPVLMGLCVLGMFLIWNRGEVLTRDQLTVWDDRNSTAQANGLVFGPVIERVINDPDYKQGSEAVDLETGRSLSYPAVLHGPNVRPERLAAWLRENGADLLAGHKGAWGIGTALTNELKLVLVSDDSWEKMIPQELAKAETGSPVNTGNRWETFTTLELSPTLSALPDHMLTKEEGNGFKAYFLPTDPQFPVTFAFHTTRQGSVGLLQITGISDDRHGLKIRFKLLYPKANPPSGSTGLAPKGAYGWLSALWQRPRSPASRSPFPKAAHIGRNDRSVMLYHDDVDLYYALLYAGDFNSSTRGSNNPRTKTWIDNGSLTLTNGRTVGYLRTSEDPNTLVVNGRRLDLRRGRLFVLQNDGSAGQLALFPSLAEARDVDMLARLIAGDSTPLETSTTPGLSFGPEQVVILDRGTNGTGQRFLDLDTGKAGRRPNGVDATSELSIAGWMMAKGYDLLISDGPNGSCHIVTARTNGLKLVRVPAAIAKLAGPDALPAILEQSDSGLEEYFAGVPEIWKGHLLPMSLPPDLTLAFQTREGRIGVLRIDGREAGHQLKIRYKLVNLSPAGDQGSLSPSLTPPVFVVAAGDNRARLANGSEIELTTVAHTKDGRSTWWNADGSLLETPPGTVIMPTTWDIEAHRRTNDFFALIVRVTPDGTRAKVYELDPPVTARSTGRLLRDGVQVTTDMPLTFTYLDPLKPVPGRINLRFGAAIGPTRTVARFDGSLVTVTGVTANVRFQTPFRKGPDTILRVECPPEMRDCWMAVGARQKNGHWTDAFDPSDAVGTPERQFHFSNLRPSDLMEYVVEFVPWYWVEFRDVALKPRFNLARAEAAFERVARTVDAFADTMETATNAAAASTGGTATFGTAIARTMLGVNESRTNCFLDLDSGRIVEPPPTLNLKNREAVWQWAKETGVDVVAKTTTDIRGFLGYELTRTLARDEDWESPDWKSIHQSMANAMWAHARPGFNTDPLSQAVITANTLSTAPKRTYAFQTREGGFGLLQFIEYTDAPRGSIRIHYKLVSKSPPALREQIELLIRDAPASVKYDLEIWELEPGMRGSYRIRGDVVSRRLLPPPGVTNFLFPSCVAFQLPASNRFYLQYDPAGASTLHYYGPFQGNLAGVLGLSQDSEAGNSPADRAAREAAARNAVSARQKQPGNAGTNTPPR